MSYDWKEKSDLSRFTLDWYDDIDQRWLRSARLFNGTPNPFVELMNLDDLSGKRVLEIGCGMGFHTELMLRAGADLTSIDISPTSVLATRERLLQKGLQGDIREMDAEKLDFPDGTFDFVWSWGVIHHSAHTGRVVREIDRVLKPRSEARIMVYNLEGMAAYTVLARKYMFRFWCGRSLDEILWQNTDGFTARYYTHDGLRDLLLTFFDAVETRAFGQDADAIPLPRRLRKLVANIVPVARQERLSRVRGSLLFAVAKKMD